MLLILNLMKNSSRNVFSRALLLELSWSAMIKGQKWCYFRLLFHLFEQGNLFRHNQHKHHNTLCLHYFLRCSSSNLHHTTDVTLGVNSQSGDGRILTEQALARASYIRESSTSCYLWWWAGLAARECGCLSLLWQRPPSCLYRSMERHHNPSKTSGKWNEYNRTRNRSGEPTLWQLTCHLMGRRTCQTGDFWLQNTRERNSLYASDLRKNTRNIIVFVG